MKDELAHAEDQIVGVRASSPVQKLIRYRYLRLASQKR